MRKSSANEVWRPSPNLPLKVSQVLHCHDRANVLSERIKKCREAGDEHQELMWIQARFENEDRIKELVNSMNQNELEALWRENDKHEAWVQARHGLK